MRERNSNTKNSDFPISNHNNLSFLIALTESYISYRKEAWGGGGGVERPLDPLISCFTPFFGGGGLEPDIDYFVVF